jgi:tRNA(Ile)-lysidine synthase
MEMLTKVQEFIEDNQLLTPNERIIVGVSGGIDSVVLLNVLSKLGYDCVVAHCNFHLRGEESNRDEKFVEDLSKSYEVVFKKIDFDTVTYAKAEKISIEMAARELRYSWFEKLAQEINVHSIAVAHHSDDSIETVMLNIVRGTGIKGLIGILPRNGKIVRPLLCCSRFEIEEYARLNDIAFVNDSTNEENDFNRNKIRNQVLPILAEINPSVKQTLFENINRIKGAWKIYEQKIKEIKDEITFYQDDRFYIDIEKLKKQPDVKTVLFEILDDFNFNNEVLEDIVKSLDGESGKKFSSSTHRLIKDRNFLIIDENEPDPSIEWTIEEGTNIIENPIHLEFNLIEKNENFIVSKLSEKVDVDADKISFPLILRKWHYGDTFQPFGMNQEKKVSDFFVDEKLNLFQKEDAWLLTSNGEIVWIVGIRLDNRFRITENTQKILEITWKK